MRLYSEPRDHKGREIMKLQGLFQLAKLVNYLVTHTKEICINFSGVTVTDIDIGIDF